METPLKKDITYFGKTDYRHIDKLFGIRRRDRRQHMYVVGKSGTGKSVMLHNMIIQDIKRGEGVCVVDPHGELAEDVLRFIPPERMKDVIYFNPADTDHHIGFNVLELVDPKYKHLIASGLMGIFTKIWANAWSARMEYIMNNAILALLDTPGSTLLGIPRLLVDKGFREQVISNLKDPVVRAFWVNEYESWQDRFRNEAIAPIQNKVGQFLSTSIIRNIVGQQKSTIDIFNIMNTQKIFIVNVSKGRVGEDNSSLLGAIIITKLQLAAMERVRIPEEERKDFYLYVDEFQNFVTDSFASILSEARKYRLDLILAHQYIAQLATNESTQVRDAVFGNVGTMIVFRVGAADAEFLEQEFTPEFEIQDFVNLPNYHIYLKLMVDGVTTRPFSAKTLPPFEEEESENAARAIIESSRNLYARSREVVEKEIEDWSRSATGQVTSFNKSQGGTGAMSGGANEGSEVKFKAECAICGKEVMVPFEPIAGLPVYCREHHAQVKAGEIAPVPAQTRRRPPKKIESTAPLANLGIEFTAAPSQQQGSRDTKNDKKDTASSRPATFKRSTPSNSSQAPTEKKPIIKKTFEPKKAAAPDKSALKSALSEALGGAAHRETKEVKEEVSVITSSVPQKTISLSALKSTAGNDEKEEEDTKGPSQKTMSALRDILHEVSPEPEEKIPSPIKEEDLQVAKELEEQKELLEKAKREAEEKAAAMRREMELEQEKRKKVEEEARQHAEKLLAEEQKRKDAEERANRASSEVEQERQGRMRAEEEKRRSEEEIRRAKIRAEEDSKKFFEEKRKSDEEKLAALRKADQLEQEKIARERKDADEKARKEVPEDILNSVFQG